MQTGNLLFLSGMLRTEGHRATFIGRVGAEPDVEPGRKAAHLAALNALAYPALGLLLVGLLLAYSRGSVLAMAIGCALWFILVPLRLRGVAGAFRLAFGDRAERGQEPLELMGDRATFLLDPEGIVRHACVSDPSVTRSPDDTLSVLRALRAADPALPVAA